jgi:hypothetical protein
MNKANHVLLQGMEDGTIPMADADAVASGIMEILMRKDKYLQDAYQTRTRDKINAHQQERGLLSEGEGLDFETISKPIGDSDLKEANQTRPLKNFLSLIGLTNPA